MDWSSSIRGARNRLGVKQGRFAELLGVDQATVSRWERGNHTPPMATQQMYMRRLAVFDPFGRVSQRLVARVRATDQNVILTKPGSLKREVMSKSAERYLGLEGRGPGDPWWDEPRSEMFDLAAGELTGFLTIIQDQMIQRFETWLNVSRPNLPDIMTRTTTIPYHCGEPSPRLLVYQEHSELDTGQAGYIKVHRLLMPTETITIPNQKSRPCGRL